MDDDRRRRVQGRRRVAVDGGKGVPPDLVPDLVPMVVDTPPIPPAARHDRASTGVRAAVTVALAVAMAAAVVLVVRDPAPTDLPPAPSGPVDVGWSVVVPDAPSIMAGPAGPAAAEPTLDIASGVVVHVLRSRAGQATTILQRSASTGRVNWERAIEPGIQPVVVASGRVVGGPAGRSLSVRDGARSLRGLSMADGSTLWEQPIGGDFVGWIDPSGGLFVSGNAQCGYVDPTSGGFLFLRQALDCVPAGDGLALDAPDGWVVVDKRGQRLATEQRTAVVPRVVAGRVVAAGRDEVRTIDPGGREQVVAAPRLTRLADRAVDPHHLAALAGDEQYVVDLAEPAVTGPYAPFSRPIVVDGELRILDDGSFPQPELVASGAWSRSPDANRVRVLDGAGVTLASREVVLAQPMLPTAEGVLLWEQVGTDSTLGLYGYDDLQPRWEVSFRGTPLAGMASSDQVVVASYLDEEGNVRVVGLRAG